MSNILLISDIFPPKVGGSGRWFWEIYSRLEGHYIIIAAGNDTHAGEFDQTHRLNCLRWPLYMENWGILNFSGFKNYLTLFFRLALTAKKEKITAIHCGRGLPEGLLGYLAYKFMNIPYLCYVHGEELATYHTDEISQFISNLFIKMQNR